MKQVTILVDDELESLLKQYESLRSIAEGGARDERTQTREEYREVRARLGTCARIRLAFAYVTQHPTEQ